MRKRLFALVAAASLCAMAGAQAELAAGYWSESQADEILAQTLRIELSPSLKHLSAAERAALQRLLAAGRVLHDLYLQQNHPQALAGRDTLRALHRDGADTARTGKLLDLYRLAKGPVITTLGNQRVAFVPVVPERPGRNVYPLDLAAGELEQFAAGTEPQAADVLAPRTVVRRRTAATLDHYIDVLEKWPALDALHPALRASLEYDAGQTPPGGFVAIPYSVEYAADIAAVYADLNAAASQLARSDADFSAYLANRARDLLSDNYEAGDASWVTGRFGNLNAQIGSYETYDDKLFGVKTFFSMSILARDEAKSRRLAGALGDIQAIEDSLPYDMHKSVRADIPVGVYNVVADFGQARGANTATILPNDPAHARKYGRTILLRYNIMTDPQIFANAQRRFTAVTEPAVHDDLTSEGGFNRTLFHEIGHYLGVAETRDGHSLDIALGKDSDLLEELKSDLVSLYAVAMLVRSGFYSTADARSVYASGISRTLQVVQPRRNQPYQTMQLMQFNYFLENGVLSMPVDGNRLAIDYERYPDAVNDLLATVLEVQAAGDPAGAEAFIKRWGYWRPNLHGELGARMRAAVTHRYTLLTYAAENEQTPAH